MPQKDTEALIIQGFLWGILHFHFAPTAPESLESIDNTGLLVGQPSAPLLPQGIKNNSREYFTGAFTFNPDLLFSPIVHNRRYI